jgi:hypothetical protein
LSTTAATDPEIVRQRPCRLCPNQLFELQKGIPFGDDLVILCNPYPVLDEHLTIVDRDHVSQAIAGRLDRLLDLTRGLDGRFLVFYNGPQCGASVPEHFHVQAVPWVEVPICRHLSMIDTDSALQVHKRIIAADERIEVFALRDYYTSVLIYRGSDRRALSSWVTQTLHHLASVTNMPDEPLVNLLFAYDAPCWTAYLFPRKKHRPDCFFDGTLTFSPASLDLAGSVVLPVEKQFQEIHAEQISDVLAEVDLDPRLFRQLLSFMDGMTV